MIYNKVMVTKAIFAKIIAKEGKEKEVEEFLRSARGLILEEEGTINWYAVKISELEYGIFDTFQDNSGRLEHLHGKVAKALMERAPDLFNKAPSIEQFDIIADNN